MFTTPLLIATLLAAVLGAAIGFLTNRCTVVRLRGELAAAVWQLTHDPLTGLNNRAGLRAVHAALAASSGTRQLLVVLIDLDRFKHVNDHHGHDTGDELLTITADRIRHLVDLHGGHAARLSGDEFAAILPADNTRLDSMAERLITIIAEPTTMTTDAGPVTLAVTASLGVAVASSTDLLEAGLHHADLAMFHAKQEGGNRHVRYRSGMTMPSRPQRRGPRLRDQRHRQNGSGA